MEEAGGTTGLLAGSGVRSSRRCVGLASAQRSGKESEGERDIGSWDGVQCQEYPKFTQLHSSLIPHRSRWSYQVVHQLVCTKREGMKELIIGGESVEEVCNIDLLLPLHHAL